MELLRFLAHIVVAVQKVELIAWLAVYEDTTQACRIVAADGVVLSIASRVVDGVLVEVVHGVKLAGNDVAELAVHSPCPYTPGNLLVATQRVTTIRIEVAIGIIRLFDIAVSIHLLKHLCLHGGHAGNE